MRFGRILGVLVVLLLVGGAATGFWYWKSRGGEIRAASALPVLETDSTLSRRVAQLRDSLQHLDFALREAQLADSEPPVDLARRQSELWSRYTWARSRLSDVRDAKMDTAKASVQVGDGIGKVLGSLALYLWVAAGVAALALAFMIWWFFGRRSHESETPLTEPTLTRMDRNVRMPLSGGDGAGSRSLAREATFSQMRAARAGAEPAARDRGPSAADPDLPSAPPPKTGRHAWENTTSQPGGNMPAPAEPTVVQDYVVSMAKRGRTSSEIARRLRIPQDQVDLILKLRRNG